MLTKTSLGGNYFNSACPLIVISFHIFWNYLKTINDSGEIYFTRKLTAYCLLFSHLVAVAGNNAHYTGLVKSETGASGVRLDRLPSENVIEGVTVELLCRKYKRSI